MDSRLENALDLILNFKLEEAREILEELLENDSKNLPALVALAKIHSRTQSYGEAMNLFQQVLAIDSDNSEAVTGLQLIKNILQLTNNYYYENPYTDDDLYDN